MDVADFQAIIKATDTSTIVRRLFLSRGCHALTDELDLDLRQRVAEKFQVDPEKVYIVGSGKLGFSIKPGAVYRAYDPVAHDSDIDVAIADPILFTRIWSEADTYRESGTLWPEEQEFYRYLKDGWIRPDMFPNSRSFEFSTEWWNFFESLRASGRYGLPRIRGALYVNEYFLERYQRICVYLIKQSI